MKKLRIIFACLLSAIVSCTMFGCSAAEYNTGYDALWSYIFFHNESSTQGMIQASYEGNVSSYYYNCVFATGEQGEDILVDVAFDGLGAIEFLLDGNGFSEDEPLEMSIRTEQIGGFYFRGRTTVCSSEQDEFDISKLEFSYYQDWSRYGDASEILGWRDIIELEEALGIQASCGLSVFESFCSDEFDLELTAFEA